MAKGSKRRGRPKRSLRKGRSRSGPVNRMSSMPPSLSLQSNVFSTWLRSETNVVAAQKYWVNEWTFDELLAAEYKGLSTIFAEYRLKRVNVWFIPSVAITSVGIHAMAVYDDGDNYFISPTLSDVTAGPGSHVAKVYQVLHSNWHRTEPADKNWILANNNRKPFSVAIATSSDGIKGVVICDISISFRGLKAASSKLTRNDVRGDAAPSLSARSQDDFVVLPDAMSPTTSIQRMDIKDSD